MTPDDSHNGDSSLVPALSTGNRGATKADFRLSGDRQDRIEGLGESQVRYLISLLSDERPVPPEFSAKEWLDLRITMEKHGVTPMVARKINAIPAASRPPDSTQSGIKNIYLRSSMNALHREKRVKEIITALAGAGVDALAMKGVALAYSAYPDPATRPGKDIDLLISPSDVLRAGTVLEGLGYVCVENNYDVSASRRHEEVFVYGTDNVRYPPVELHWNLFPHFMMNRQADVAPLFKRAVTIDMNGFPIRAMHPADELVQEATHAVYGHSGQMKLIWAVDTGLLCQKLGTPQEWRQVQAISVEYMGRIALERSIRVAQTWTGLRMPEAFGDFDRWPRPSRREAYFYSYFTTRSPVSGLKLALLGGGSLHETAADVARYAFPDAAIMRQQYPSLQGWPLPLVYARRWLQLLSGR